jgi:transcription termination factor Rho
MVSIVKIKNNMKSKEEVRDWLLENCMDEDGDLDLKNLDFSKFNGDIYISNMKVKNSLFQSCQKVGGRLFQGKQDVTGIIID